MATDEIYTRHLERISNVLSAHAMESKHTAHKLKLNRFCYSHTAHVVPHVPYSSLEGLVEELVARLEKCEVFASVCTTLRLLC